MNDAGSSDLLLCDNLEVWDGVGWKVGGDLRRRGRTYVWLIHVDMAETNTML